MLKKTSKIQDGHIIYSDLNQPAKSLFSKKYILAGKPDYIIKKDNKFIPVEFKTTKRNHPQAGHILQLAAYCHLIEENYGGFVPYGVLVYNNSKEFKINFDPKLRFELESSINLMRNMLKTGKVTRNHNESARCINCSMKEYCKINL